MGDAGTKEPHELSGGPLSFEPRVAAKLAEAVAIMARLRGPGGCPWDREQTFDTIKRHTLEETYEVFDAIERRAWPELKDELGDLLLQVLFYAQMAKDAGYFDIGDVAAGLNAKLVRRHPHVFGDVDAADADAVLRNWEEIKRAEKADAAGLREGAGASSGLDEIPRSMPAVMEAGKLGSRAAKVGFDWPSVDGLFEKLQEEIGELKAEVGSVAVAPFWDSRQKGSSDRGEAEPLGVLRLRAARSAQDDIESKKSRGTREAAIEEELGDLLFTAVNLARHLRVDAEMALRGANAKFRGRFAAMERMAGGFEALRGLGAAELEGLWGAAKQEMNSHVRREAV
jgi:nucleoside triphosphate diphosphatase